MSIHKRKTVHGHTWFYAFDAPDSIPKHRRQITKSGFSSKKEALQSEAERRVKVADEHEAAKRGRTSIPKTLKELLVEFCADCDSKRLSPKTVERYREHIGYLSVEILALPLPSLTVLHFHHEWKRLRDAGGRGRRAGKELSPKTVKNIAGMVSSAFGRAVFWGLIDRNPVEKSEPPRLEKRDALALSPTQQRTLLEASTHPALPVILELCAATGARRGEVMALRWSDIQGDRATIGRSLAQVKDQIFFKGTKGRKARTISLPISALAFLSIHRSKQDVFRDQFGADYQKDLDLIVCAPDGSALKPNSISASVSALCRRLKLPKGVSLHTLRHSHASHLLVGGMEVTAVSARLGHATVSTTLDIYSHVIAGRDDEAAKVWEKLQNRDLPGEKRKTQ